MVVHTRSQYACTRESGRQYQGVHVKGRGRLGKTGPIWAGAASKEGAISKGQPSRRASHVVQAPSSSRQYAL